MGDLNIETKKKPKERGKISRIIGTIKKKCEEVYKGGSEYYENIKILSADYGYNKKVIHNQILFNYHDKMTDIEKQENGL